jgi:hypothetical protein
MTKEEAIININAGIHFIEYKQFIHDKEVVLVAVKKDHHNFLYLGADMCNDKEVVIEAIKKEGDYLEYASDKLKDDYDVVLLSVINDGYPIQFASERLRGNKELGKIAVRVGTRANTIKYLNESLKKDVEIAKIAIESNPLSFQYIHNDIKNERSILEHLECMLERVNTTSSLYDEIKEKLKILELYREEDKLIKILKEKKEDKKIKVRKF